MEVIVTESPLLPFFVKELFAFMLTFLWHRDVGRLKCIFRRFSRHRKLLDRDTIASVQEYDEKQELLEERLCWLVAKDCSILIGKYAMTPVVLSRLYTFQYGESVFGHVGRSVTKLVKDHPKFLLLLKDGMVKATRDLNIKIQYTLQAKELLTTVSLAHVKPVENKGRKGSHTLSKNLRKKQRVFDCDDNSRTPPQLPNCDENMWFKEERARLALLERFGCPMQSFFDYHTLLHPNLLSYQQTWRIVENKSDEWCVGAHFEQSVCPMDHDLVLFYTFEPGRSPQDLAQVIEANKSLALITCGESSSDETTPPLA